MASHMPSPAAGPSGYDAFLEWMSSDDNPIADELYDVPPAVHRTGETDCKKSADDPSSYRSLYASQNSQGAPTKAKSYQQLIAEKKAAKKHAEKPDGGAKSYQQLIAEKKAAKKLAGQ